MDVARTELASFLQILGVDSLLAGRTVGGGFFALDLNEVATTAFGSRGKSVLLGIELDGRKFPLSIFFIEAGTQKFGHATLLLTSYAEGPQILPRLQKAMQDFFTRSELDLLVSLNPAWRAVTLTGNVDKRPLWDQELAIEFHPSFSGELAFDVPKVPVLPSVYHFNNPYFKHLLEVSIPSLKQGDRVLTLGSGVGAETIFLARKTVTSVDAVDINPLAVLNTKMTAARAGMSNYINAWQSDLFSEVYEKYDMIFFNAPLAVGKRDEEDRNRFDINGNILRRTLEMLPSYLSPHGRLVMMSHPDIREYLPKSLDSSVKRLFQAAIPHAIHEVSLNRAIGSEISSDSYAELPQKNLGKSQVLDRFS